MAMLAHVLSWQFTNFPVWQICCTELSFMLAADRPGLYCVPISSPTPCSYLDTPSERQVAH